MIAEPFFDVKSDFKDVCCRFLYAILKVVERVDDTRKFNIRIAPVTFIHSSTSAHKRTMPLSADEKMMCRVLFNDIKMMLFHV